MASILPSLVANSETLRIRSQIMFVLQKSSGVNCRCLPLAAHPTSAATMPRRRPVACKLGPCVTKPNTPHGGSQEAPHRSCIHLREHSASCSHPCLTSCSILTAHPCIDEGRAPLARACHRFLDSPLADPGYGQDPASRILCIFHNLSCIGWAASGWPRA